ncbi:MAG: HDIG domain-containing protein [Desulfovibrionaceae bacterium]|nr:HDIG domain-containing protein [Desulfovibrionaceae bacterium]
MHTAATKAKDPELPALNGLPYLAFPSNETCALDSDAICYDLWQQYSMPKNIQDHSKLVANVAWQIAQRVLDAGIKINVDLVRQSALLHDLGKAYSLEYGGSHAVLGAAWVVAATGNYALAQGVLYHVYWPWDLPEGPAICSLPIIVLYADKRAKHADCVTLEEREEDLLLRYGSNPSSRKLMAKGFEQIRNIERALSDCLDWGDLDAYSFDSRRLVN